MDNESLVKEPTCFKIPSNPSRIFFFFFFLTGKIERFQNSCCIEKGLSNFYKMSVSALKMGFRKLAPRVVSYKD